MASTTRLQFGSAIASLYARDASTAAMATHTLAELSEGRFALGLGVSIRWLVEQRGQVWEKPLQEGKAYLDGYEAMEVCRQRRSVRPRRTSLRTAPKMVAAVKDRVDGLITINVPPAHPPTSERNCVTTKTYSSSRPSFPRPTPTRRENWQTRVGVCLSEGSPVLVAVGEIRI